MLQSKYTTTFNNFVESYWIEQHPNDTKADDYSHKRQEKILFALPAIFDFDFPIWDPNYRTHLEYMIVSHYYLDEVAYETWGQFKMNLENWLNEQMPRFNVLYNAGATLGDIYTIGYIKDDEYHGTDKNQVDNTGTQENKRNYDRSDSTDYNYIKDNTGTQVNDLNIKNTGTVGNTGHKSNDDWISNRDIANGSAYKDDTYISTASHNELSEDTNSTRTDDTLEEHDGLREDNLKESRTDKTDRLIADTDNAIRTDNLKEIKEGREDNNRHIKMTYDVQDKMTLYNKLWNYYKDVDDEIILDMSVLFLQIW